MRFAQGTIALILTLTLILASSTAAEPGWVRDAVEAAWRYQPHPEAKALTLLKSIETRIDDDGYSQSKVRLVVKLLASDGEDYCMLHESATDWRRIEGLDGWHIDPDGNTHELDDDQQAYVSADTTAGYYDDETRFIAMFDRIRPGSIVAYEYEIDSRPSWGDYCGSFRVQVQQPVFRAEFEIETPKHWHVNVVERNIDNGTLHVDGNKRTWSFKKLPYVPHEPLMPPWSEISKEIMVCCYNEESDHEGQFATWEDVAAWTSEIQKLPETPDPVLHDFCVSRFGSLSSKEEKFAAIVGFVRDHIRYVAVEIDEGRFVPRPPHQTLSNRFGDCKDKSTLMRALLAAQGIESTSALACLGGRVDPSIPSPFQFNHVVVAMKANQVPDEQRYREAFIEDWLFYDPTCPWLEVGSIPYSLHGSYVLIADTTGHPLVRIPAPQPTSYKRCYVVNAYLQDDGSLEAKVRIVDRGLRARESAYRQMTANSEDEIDYWRSAYRELLPTAEIADFHIAHNDDSSWITFTILSNEVVQDIGDLHALSIDLTPIYSFERLEDVQRLHPVWLGNPKEYEGVTDWSFAEGWRLESSADTVAANCLAGGFEGHVECDSTSLNHTWKISLNGKQIPVKEYSSARAICDSIDRFRNARVFINRLGEETQ